MIRDDKSVQRVSRAAALICLLLAAVLPVAVVYGSRWSDPTTPLMPLPVLCMSLSLLAARRCFRSFAEGDYFGARQPRAIQSAGRWSVLAAVSGLLLPTVASLLKSVFSAGAGHLVIEISSTSLLGLVFGALLWCLGHVWEKARDLAAENAQFV